MNKKVIFIFVVVLVGVVIICKMFSSNSSNLDFLVINSKDDTTFSTVQIVEESNESRIDSKSETSQTSKHDMGLFDNRYTGVSLRELVNVKQLIVLQRINDEKFIQNFSFRMNQHYKRIDEHKLVQTEFDNITVKGEHVHWNILDEWRKYEDEYLVVDSFEEKDLGYLYLFVIHNRKPMVLYTKATSDDLMVYSMYARGTSKPLDFRETENEWLAGEFERLVNRNVMIQNNFLKQRIKAVINQYTKEKDQSFIELTPATSRNYYQILALDDVLEYSTVNGQKVSFKWYGWFKEQGEQLYEIVAAYIASDGKELIVFAYDEQNQPIVLKATDEPIIKNGNGNSSSSVELNLKTDLSELLNSVF